ncbi:MAG: hypothetical protein L0J31_00855 [Corynebacterium sp.]|nr:hypothetical protein [Corynebacterium sp.]
MTRNRRVATARTVATLATSTVLLFGLSACSFETVFTTTQDDGTADRAQALSAPGSAELWRTSGTGPDVLNADAQDGSAMSFVDPDLLEDGELPARMSVTEAQSLQVLQKIADMVEQEGRRISEVASLRVYLTPEDGAGTADFEGWERAYRKFFANLDPLTGDSLLTGTSAVTLTAETSPSSRSATSAPASPSASAITSAPSSPGTEPTDTTGDDEAPYSGDTNPTKPTVVTVGVAEQPVAGWLVQVEAEVLYDND